MVLSRRTVLSLAAMATLINARAFAGDAPLKIATIGAGNIGSTLGGVWAKNGHPVMLSSRHPEELKDEVAAMGPNARAGTVAEAVAFGDVILLAVPFSAMPGIAKDFAPQLAKKVLILDATNPIARRDGAMADEAVALGAGLATAKLLPGARIVRAFNAIGAARFGQGGRAADGTRIGIPVAGEDQQALAIATALINETGFEPVIVGNLDFGKHLRPGTPLAGERSADEIRKVAASLK